MRKITLLLVFGLLMLVLVLFSAYASDLSVNSGSVVSKSTISGTITDKLNNEPLAGVEIKLMDSNVKVYSDFEGKFVIKDVQPGAHAIIINFISYQNTVENILTVSGNTTTVKIKLKNAEK